MQQRLTASFLPSYITCLAQLFIFQIFVNQSGAFYYSQASDEDVFRFFQRQTNDSYRFISELMDAFSLAGVHQQAEQPNYLAEGQTLL